jgi:hypothetical protein
VWYARRVTPTLATATTAAAHRAAALRRAAPQGRPTRSRYDWTPADYLAAVGSAESGNMTGLGQFVRWLMTDGKVKAALQQRVDVMFGLEMRFDPPINVPEDWYEAFPDTEQMRLLYYAILAGWCWVRFKPVLDADPLKLEVEVWSPEHFDYRAHESQWYVRTVESYGPVTDGVEGWRLFTPFGKHEPWQWGLWMVLAVPALLKHYALDDRARNSEVGALLVGELADAQPEEREDFLAQLQELAKETRIVLPEGGKLSMLDRATTGQASVQKETIDWADNEIVFALLGQSVTSEGAAGFSSGGPQMVVLNAILRAQEKAYSQFAGVKLLSPWLELMHPLPLDAYTYLNPNFNRIVYPHWPVEIDTEQQSEATKFDARMQAFLKAIEGVKKVGLELTQSVVDMLARRYDVPSFKLPTLAAPAGELPPGAPGPAALPAQASAIDDLTDEDAQRIAEQMTAGINGKPVPRCEHGSLNRCRLCGVERTRSFAPVLNATGQPTYDDDGHPVVQWQIAWRPIQKPAPVTP